MRGVVSVAMRSHRETADELFGAALELPAAARPAFLDRECGDPRLRQAVEALLAAHDDAGSFLGHPVFAPATVDAPGRAKAIIGPYFLLELIGEGGMGEVWLAEQRQPVRRRVAIKLIKLGMDTREVVARFESERQALALMDHPAIAKVFDAGSTPEGRPYFVMEYVAGIPITAYCDKHKLTVRQRMELFIQVCEGVQHAHQKAIIHRDLKPSNILVSEMDGKPIPRIIDFGVAKATSQKLTAGTMYTQIGTVIGTIGYISPEQADSGGEDIDTRTDVYSLGAVLFELLAGSLPLDFGKLAFDEVLRRLREQDAPRPSTRLRTLGEGSSLAAKNRGVDPSVLSRQLRGDADAIALKALEKDRARRYASASGLAADIERYLRNEPVTAHAPGAAYRARKYVRRHRLGVAMATLGVLLLIGFAIVQAVQLRRIRRERDRADRITEFMTGMFKISDPSETRGNAVTAREILDKASGEIDTSLTHDPELQSQMMATMADTYYGLGLLQEAVSLDERASAVAEHSLGRKHPETLHIRAMLADRLPYLGRISEAETIGRATLADDVEVLGPENLETLKAQLWLADTLDFEEKYAEAEILTRDTLEKQRRLLGPENNDTITTMYSLAETLRLAKKYPESEALMRKVLELRRRTLGPEHPYTVGTMTDLGLVLANEGHYAEAEPLQRAALAINTRTLGRNHLRTMDSLSGLADAVQGQGRHREAEALEREAYTLRLQALGSENPYTVWALHNLAVIVGTEGRYQDAEKLFRQEIESGTKGKYTPAVADGWYDFACMAAKAGHHDEALDYLSHAVDNGFRRSEWIAADKDFASLHGDPRFDAIVTKARQ